MKDFSPALCAQQSEREVECRGKVCTLLQEQSRGTSSSKVHSCEKLALLFLFQQLAGLSLLVRVPSGLVSCNANVCFRKSRDFYLPSKSAWVAQQGRKL
jgi:hypothetical protein